jgi:signal transduction histidine kinase
VVLERRSAELASMNRDLRALSSRILSVQEEERRRISRDLHDEISQALTAIHMNLGLIERSGVSDAMLPKSRIDDTKRLLERTMDTVHRFARELRHAR